jgi:hypothetical protein
MDQNKGELLCTVRNGVSALSLEHNGGGDVRIKKIETYFTFFDWRRS